MSAVNYSQFHGSKRCPECGWQSLTPTAPGERWHCLVCKAEHTMPDELTRLQPTGESDRRSGGGDRVEPNEAVFWRNYHYAREMTALYEEQWRKNLTVGATLSHLPLPTETLGPIPAPSEPRHVLAAVCNTCDRTPETTALATCHYCHQHVCADCLVVVREGDEFRDSCPKCQGRKVQVQARAQHIRGELVTAAVVVSIVTVSLFGASLLMTFPFLGGVWVAGMLLLIAAVLVRSWR